MRRLILLRHAKSDWSEPGKADLGRPLNPRGREAAVLIGEYMMKHHLVPDRAVVSTAERTRETWSLVAGAFKQPPKGSFDARLYEAPPELLLDVIKETKPAIHTLLVIGHNPGLHDARDSPDRYGRHRRAPAHPREIADWRSRCDRLRNR